MLEAQQLQSLAKGSSWQNLESFIRLSSILQYITSEFISLPFMFLGAGKYMADEYTAVYIDVHGSVANWSSGQKFITSIQISHKLFSVKKWQSKNGSQQMSIKKCQ